MPLALRLTCRALRDASTEHVETKYVNVVSPMPLLQWAIACGAARYAGGALAEAAAWVGDTEALSYVYQNTNCRLMRNLCEAAAEAGQGASASCPDISCQR